MIHNIEVNTPLIEGAIRFSYQANDQKGLQSDRFELLSHVHAEPPEANMPPVMLAHPLSHKLAGKQPDGRPLLEEIPIRLFFDKTEQNLHASYQAVDQNTGAILCRGNGCLAARKGADGACSQVKCPGPRQCDFTQNSGASCDLHVRLLVQVEGSDDPLACFEFQSTGINTYRTLKAKLTTLEAAFGGLRGLPLRLTRFAKSSRGSSYLPFYVANIELRHTVTLKAAHSARQDYIKEMEFLNFDQVDAVWDKERTSSAFSLEGEESTVLLHFAGARPQQAPSVVTEHGGCAAKAQADDIFARLRGASPEQKENSTQPSAQSASEIALDELTVPHNVTTPQKSTMPLDPSSALSFNDDETYVLL